MWYANLMLSSLNVEPIKEPLIAYLKHLIKLLEVPTSLTENKL